MLCDVDGTMRWLKAWMNSVFRPQPKLQDGLRGALRTLEGHLNRDGIKHALIGGLGLAAQGQVRATTDIDYLVHEDSMPPFEERLRELGFETLHRTPDVGNYVLDTLRVDALVARRPASQRMLNEAERRSLDGVELTVLRLVDILGLKLQALRGGRRPQDRADIAKAISDGLSTSQKQQLREYAKVLDLEALLDELELDR